MLIKKANGEYLDQTASSEASDLGLPCLSISNMHTEELIVTE